MKEGKLVHSKTGLCLDTTGLHPRNDVQVNICSNSSNQIWQFDFYEGKVVQK